jgi:hypothetical protein
MKTKKKLTKKELRIAVAKDVLKSLTEFKPRAGEYFSKNFAPRTAKKILDLKTSNQQAKALSKNCEACAIGACFLSMVALDNKFDFSAVTDRKWGDELTGLFYLDDNVMRGRLESAFSMDQLCLIEQAFERGCGPSWKLSPEEEETAEKFGIKFRSDRGRLGAIMKNIVENSGTLKPEEK